MIKNVFIDFYYLCLIIVYWLLAILILLPVKCLDRRLGTKGFKYLDKRIKKISNA